MSEGAAIPAAVLWDMDGTLVDTEPYWIACEYELVAEHGGTWSEDHAHAIVGMDLRDAAAYIRDHGPVDMAVDDIVNRLLDGVTLMVRESRAVAPGSAGAARRPARATACPMRAGDDVVASLRRRGRRSPAGRLVRRDRRRRRGGQRQARSRAVHHGSAAARRRRPRLRGHRGLAHRHPLGGRRRLPRGGRAQRRPDRLRTRRTRSSPTLAGLDADALDRPRPSRAIRDRPRRCARSPIAPGAEDSGDSRSAAPVRTSRIAANRAAGGSRSPWRSWPCSPQRSSSPSPATNRPRLRHRPTSRSTGGRRTGCSTSPSRASPSTARCCARCRRSGSRPPGRRRSSRTPTCRPRPRRS